MIFILYYFLLGVIFCYFFEPILESITSVVLSFLELVKSHIGLRITKNNIAAQNLNEQKTTVLGFKDSEEG